MAERLVCESGSSEGLNFLRVFPGPSPSLTRLRVTSAMLVMDMLHPRRRQSTSDVTVRRVSMWRESVVDEGVKGPTPQPVCKTASTSPGREHGVVVRIRGWRSWQS